jgi:hypothetical protein
MATVPDAEEKIKKASDKLIPPASQNREISALTTLGIT